MEEYTMGTSDVILKNDHGRGEMYKIFLQV